MNLQQLQALGGVLPSAPVPQEITWTRIDEATGEELGDTFTVFVRRLAYVDQERMMQLAGVFDHLLDDEDADESAAEKAAKRVSQKSINSALIATAIRLGDDAQEELTYEQAMQLHPMLARAMLDAISKVNPAPRKKKAPARRGSLARAGA
jgi:hypothetical protein